jgi:hypothetical protein
LVEGYTSTYLTDLQEATIQDNGNPMISSWVRALPEFGDATWSLISGIVKPELT